MSCCEVRRQEKAEITGLPLGGDGDEHLSVDGPSGCATVYVAVNERPSGLVRVNLWAALFGSRALVASAFVPSGFRGPIITVTGLQVDGWHVTFQGSPADLRLKSGIQAGEGCSGFAVGVPPRFQCAPGGTPAAMTALNPAPWTREQGLWTLHTDEAGANADANLVAGERVTGITMIASAAADGTIDIDACGGARPLITVPAGSAYELDPGGNLHGPGTITFTDFQAWTVQTLR